NDAITLMRLLYDDKEDTDIFIENVLWAAEKKLSSIEFYHAPGCKKCNQTGYKGRIGIYEVLDVDAGVADLINKHGTAPEIQEYAVTHGMITMFEDGLVKAKRGITSIEEVLRVTRE
ncbi:MAG: Type II secretion system protein E, partial [Candidatus Magasanikbacteria bacterium GW2011_GWE2_42_7]